MGYPKNNLIAAAWYARAAKSGGVGSAWAANALISLRMKRDLGEDPNPKETLALARHSAKEGFPESQLYIAAHHLNHPFSEVTLKEALENMRPAAAKFSHPYAINMLGDLYKDYDPSKAAILYALAKETVNPELDGEELARTCEADFAKLDKVNRGWGRRGAEKIMARIAQQNEKVPV
jgi:TPR repeat protein